MAISPIIGDLSDPGATNTLRMLSALRAAQASQQGVEILASQPVTSLQGIAQSRTLDNILTFSANSTLTLILAYEERKRKEGNLPDALLALAAYQAVQNFFDHSSGKLVSGIAPVSFVAQA